MDPTFLRGKLENPVTVLAVFGGTKDGVTLRHLFRITSDLLNRAGLDGNTVAIKRGDQRSGGYKRATPRRLREIEKDDIRSFSLAYVPPPETDASKFGLLEGSTLAGSFIVNGRTDLFAPNSKTISSLVEQIDRVYPVVYGYQYVIDNYYGPVYHAVGMFLTHAFRKDLPALPPTEKTRTAQWCNAHKTAVPAGFLRDVFPLNLLSEVHRNKSVNGTPLFDWIGQDSSRGKLEQITPTLWAWSVPDDRCVELGDLFESAGLLVPPPPPASPEDLAKLAQLLRSGKLVGPNTLVKTPGDKDWVEAQSSQGQARINSGIERIEALKGMDEKKKKR